MKPERAERIALGLEILAANSKPKIPHTAVEMAAYAGCTRQAIDQIVTAILAKVYRRMGPEFRAECRDYLESRIQEHDYACRKSDTMEPTAWIRS